MKVISLFFITILLLTACGPESPIDYNLYWGEISELDDIPITLSQDGEFTIHWNHEAKSDLYLYKSGVDWNDENNRIVLFADYNSTKVSCRIDSSYLEINCTNPSNTNETMRSSIAHLYSEIPTTLIFRSVMKNESELNYGRFNIQLD